MVNWDTKYYKEKNMEVIAIPQPRKRNFLPKEFKVTVWSRLKPYFNDLLKREINNVSELETWIMDKSEVDAIISETFSWRYIQITVNSSDQKATELYNYVVQELAPKITAFEHLLNQKLIECPYLDELDESTYAIHIRGLKNMVDLFREENIPLATEIEMRSKEYVKIFSEMTIGLGGTQMTLQKASSLLEEPSREFREAIYHKIHRRLLENTDYLDDLFDDLLTKRHLPSPEFRDVALHR